MLRHPNLHFTANRPQQPARPPPRKHAFELPPTDIIIPAASQIPLPIRFPASTRKRRPLDLTQPPKDNLHLSTARHFGSTQPPLSEKRNSAGYPTRRPSPLSGAKQPSWRAPNPKVSTHRPRTQRLASDEIRRRQRGLLFDNSDEDAETKELGYAPVNRSPAYIWDTLLSSPSAPDSPLVEDKGLSCASDSDEDTCHVRRIPISVSPASSSLSASSSSSYSRSDSLSVPPRIVVEPSSIGSDASALTRVERASIGLGLRSRSTSASPTRTLPDVRAGASAQALGQAEDSGYTSSSSVSFTGDSTSSPGSDSSELTTPSTSPETSFLPPLSPKNHLSIPLSARARSTSPVYVTRPPAAQSAARDGPILGLALVDFGRDPLSLGEKDQGLLNLDDKNRGRSPRRKLRTSASAPIIFSAFDSASTPSIVKGAWDAFWGASLLFADGYGGLSSHHEDVESEEQESVGRSRSRDYVSVSPTRQAFTPWDIKPYGYRVGPHEVGAVFGRAPSTSTESGDAEKTESIRSWFEGTLESLTNSIESGYDASPRSPAIAYTSRGAYGPSGLTPLPSRHRSGDGRRSSRRGADGKRRRVSPPPSTMVALQRYPVIPYNPPGVTKPEDEVFPKVRDLSKIWWYDMMPSSEKDANIDAGVPVSPSTSMARGRSPRVKRPTRLSSTSAYDSSPSPPPSPSRSPSSTQWMTSPPRARRAGRRSPSGSRGRGRGRSPTCWTTTSPPDPTESRGRSRAARPCYTSAPPASFHHAATMSKRRAPRFASAAAASSASGAMSQVFKRPPSERSYAPSIYYVWALKTALVVERGVRADQVARVARMIEEEERRERGEDLVDAVVDQVADPFEDGYAASVRAA